MLVTDTYRGAAKERNSATVLLKVATALCRGTVKGSSKHSETRSAAVLGMQLGPGTLLAMGGGELDEATLLDTGSERNGTHCKSAADGSTLPAIELDAVPVSSL